MGITIEKAIDIMEHYKEYGVISQSNGRNKAIEIMRKYQKIENIVDAYITDNPREPMYDTEDYMQNIREVVEDGKND